MKRKKKIFFIFFIMVSILVIMGIFYYQKEAFFKVTHNIERKYDIIKKDSGITVDYTKTTIRLQEIIDQVFKDINLKATSEKNNVVKIPGKNAEEVIQWNCREITINVLPEFSQEKIIAAINNNYNIKKVQGEILGIQQDNFQDNTIIRLDIGFKDDLNGNNISIISDKIYLVFEIIKKIEQREKGKLAIIIDDFGYGQNEIGAFISLGRPITFSVLPYREYSFETVSRVISSGQQAMLHLPMEAISKKVAVENMTITTKMNDATIAQEVENAIKSLPGILGVNNHQGSCVTADRRVMNVVLNKIKDNNLFFVDSRTNEKSVAFNVAKQLGLKAEVNNFFIDNDPKTDAVIKQLLRAAAGAVRNKSVIAIGHARLNTAEAIKLAIPELDKKGVKLVFVSQLVN